MTTSATATGTVRKEIYAHLKRASRVWAVSSIHGEAARLIALHGALAHRWRPGDRLVYLGNCIGRGAGLAQTIAELLSFRTAVIAQRGVFAADVAYLRGSQEEMWQKLLELQFAPNPREVLQWMLDQGVGATVAAYGANPEEGLRACREGPLAITRWTSALRAAINVVPGHRPFLTALRRAAFTDEGGVLFVHAGVAANRPLYAQKDVFWWGGGPFLELDEPFSGFRRVVRGYERQHSGIVEGQFATSLDGGCGFGGDLLAGCFGPKGELLETLKA